MMPPSIDGTDDPLSSVPGLATAAGIQRVAGKRDFYEKLVRQFAEGEESRTVETVRQLLSQDNRDEAERAAHSLKGVAGTLGADELQHRTQGLEVAIRENDNTFEFHLNTVQEELNRLIPLIQDALGVGESDSGSSSSPETIELSSKVLEKLPKLVSELEAYLDRVEELKATLTINEIEDFANEILSLGESTEYHPLSDWARRLLDAASMFEMDAISTELGAFSAQIEDIRQASK
jgi:two-component system sensor histidine kinase/response regulator